MAERAVWAATSGGPHGSFSEVELGHVLLGEQERGTEDDLRPAGALDDLVLAELAGGERLADLALDVAGGEGRGCVAREVPEILGVPEREVLERVVEEVLLHLARQTEALKHDLALVLRVREVLRRGRDANGRRRLDALEVRIRLQHALRGLQRVLRVVVAVDLD